MNKFKYTNWLLLFVLIANITTMNAQDNNDTLDKRQQSLVAISSLTATGDVENLKTQLHKGLDAGLTVNEIKEALVQLYAYCGFPRSLNAISTFMQVMDERKAQGITDEEGKEIVVENTTPDKYEQGRKVLETLTQIPQPKPARGYGDFAPRVDNFLKEHLFADIFHSDVLSFQQRELVTISALASMPGVESQLQAHIGMGINTGITKAQLAEAFDLIEVHISRQQADSAREILSKL